MNATQDHNEIVIAFSKHEAFVFFDWLARMNQSDAKNCVEDQAEERVLWDLECVLEKTIPEILRSDYKELLTRAREIVSDDDSAGP